MDGVDEENNKKLLIQAIEEIHYSDLDSMAIGMFRVVGYQDYFDNRWIVDSCEFLKWGVEDKC